MLVAGILGLMTSMLGADTSEVTWVKSLMGSNGTLPYKAGLVAWVALVDSVRV